MELTGKCKEEFEKWLLSNDINQEVLEIDNMTYYGSYDVYDLFYLLPESMQYGVYVDFFDSVEVDIVIERRRSDLFLFVIYSNCLYGSGFIPKKQSRLKAKDLAIEKADELRNEVLNK